MGRRSYLYLTLAGTTYVYTVQDTPTAPVRVRPSLAVRIAVGMGQRL